MSDPTLPAPDLCFPDLSLELIEDLSPAVPDGFLRLVRRRLRVGYPDGSRSAEFVYDEVARRAIDAVVILAHFVRDEQRWVYLRSALRPPAYFRDSLTAPAPESPPGALWELPAGLIEADEQTPAGVFEAARRELAEELGFLVDASDLHALGPSTYPSPGVIAERHFFLEVQVNPATRQEPSLDGSALERFGRVVALPLAEALESCRAGRIEDAKTELGLRRLAEHPLADPGPRSRE
jgi:ADP-ribose pyrophosphatase